MRHSYVWRNFAGMSNSDLISVAQAAEILHLSTRAVHHRITSGSLPAQKLGAGTSQYVLRRSDVEAAAAGAVA